MESGFVVETKHIIGAAASFLLATFATGWGMLLRAKSKKIDDVAVKLTAHIAEEGPRLANIETRIARIEHIESKIDETAKNILKIWQHMAGVDKS